MRLIQIVAVLTVLLACVARVTAQAPSVLPSVIHHDEPIFPAIARTAHVTGDVTVRITTDGESVADAVAESGPALLQKAAVDNVRTWKFGAHTPGTFHVTFRYKMVSGDETSFLEVPGVVQISVEPPQLIVDYSWVGIGAFKVQLSSSHGRLTKQIFFSFSGPEDDWLSAELLPLGDDIKEADYGHKEGDFLAFTIRLEEPDGQHPETFFVGRLTKNRIVGTFVDDGGVRGTWSAIKFADEPTRQ
jgi:hypothetical protein